MKATWTLGAAVFTAAALTLLATAQSSLAAAPAGAIPVDENNPFPALERPAEKKAGVGPTTRPTAGATLAPQGAKRLSNHDDDDGMKPPADPGYPSTSKTNPQAPVVLPGAPSGAPIRLPKVVDAPVPGWPIPAPPDAGIPLPPGLGGMPGPCCESCGGGCGSCGDCGACCTVSAGAIFLHRSAAQVPRSRFVVFDAGNAADDDFNLGTQAGPRIDVTWHGKCWDVEFLYYGIDGWNDTVVPNGAATFLPGQELVYTSRLYNVEINAKRSVGDRFNVLAGFRWLQLDESLDLGASFGIPTGVQSRNNLYGFQTGVDSRVASSSGRLWVDGFLKAGIYGNHVGTDLAGVGPLGGVQDSFGRAAFVGEIGFTAGCRLTKSLSAFGGYELLWIDGVSLAPDAALQYRPSNTAFLHGALVGLEARF